MKREQGWGNVGDTALPPSTPPLRSHTVWGPPPPASSKGLFHVGLPGGEMPIDLIVAWLPRGSSPSSIALGASTEAGERGEQTHPWVHFIPGEVGTGPALLPPPRGMGHIL